MAALYRHTEDLARSRPGHSVVTTRAANGTAEIRPGCVSWILAVASGRRRDGSQGGGGANSGAMGDDDNAARRPPATVRQTPVQQAEDPRDTPYPWWSWKTDVGGRDGRDEDHAGCRDAGQGRVAAEARSRGRGPGSVGVAPGPVGPGSAGVGPGPVGPGSAGGGAGSVGASAAGPGSGGRGPCGPGGGRGPGGQDWPSSRPAQPERPGRQSVPRRISPGYTGRANRARAPRRSSREFPGHGHVWDGEPRHHQRCGHARHRGKHARQQGEEASLTQTLPALIIGGS